MVATNIDMLIYVSLSNVTSSGYSSSDSDPSFCMVPTHTHARIYDGSCFAGFVEPRFVAAVTFRRKLLSAVTRVIANAKATS